MEAVADGDGKYLFVFQVSQPCEEIILDNVQMYPQIDTTLQVKSLSQIDEKIRDESSAPPPQLIQGDGTTIVSSSNLQFRQFVTDGDYADYTTLRRVTS